MQAFSPIIEQAAIASANKKRSTSIDLFLRGLVKFGVMLTMR